MEIFKSIDAMLAEAGQSVTLVITKKADELSVIVNLDLGKNDSIVPPIVIRGTAEELDGGFVQALEEPVKKQTGLITVTTAFEQGVQKVKKEMKKASKAKEKDEQKQDKTTVEAAKPQKEADPVPPQPEETTEEPQQAEEQQSPVEEEQQKEDEAQTQSQTETASEPQPQEETRQKRTLTEIWPAVKDLFKEKKWKECESLILECLDLCENQNQRDQMTRNLAVVRKNIAGAAA